MMDRTKMRASLALVPVIQTKTGKSFRARATDRGLEFEITNGNLRTVPWERGRDKLVDLYDKWVEAGEPDRTAFFDVTEVGQQNSSYLLATFKYIRSSTSTSSPTG